MPVPAARLVASWTDVRAAADDARVVVEPLRGPDGRGVHLAHQAADLPQVPPYDGPYLVQDMVPDDGSEHKVYVVGNRVAGVLRTWPARTTADKLGEPFVPDDTERSAALRAGAATGLRVYGVDLLAGRLGPSSSTSKQCPASRPSRAPRRSWPSTCAPA